MSFSQFGLDPALLQAVGDQGFAEATPIQAAAIPEILRGRDVWASAQTGSGKTAAFVLPILQLLTALRRPRGRFVAVLVLAPTRELALQTGETFRLLGRHLPQTPKIQVVHGGVSINPQMMALGGGADVMVATPGRLLDLVDHNAIALNQVSVLVLDEADRLFEEGFSRELRRILEMLPRRQNLLFSATFPPAVAGLATRILCHPVRIEAGEPVDAPDIFQRVIEVDVPRRTQLLRHLIEENQWSSVLVFVATKYATEHVADKLSRLGIPARGLHGELSQGARSGLVEDFKAGKLRVLIATDLAARGLDVVGLAAVVNYDLPRSATGYVHRIGRTGRAGESGVAVSFVSAATHAHFLLIEKRNGLDLPREQVEGFAPEEIDEPIPSTGGVKGRRKSKKDKLRAAAAREARRPGANPEAGGSV